MIRWVVHKYSSFINYSKKNDCQQLNICYVIMQGSNMAKQISAPYIECSALQSENSVRDIFHVATLACVNKNNKNVKRQKSSRATKRTSHMPSRPYLESVNSDMRKDKAKSCTVMWKIWRTWMGVKVLAKRRQKVSVQLKQGRIQDDIFALYVLLCLSILPHLK